MIGDLDSRRLAEQPDGSGHLVLVVGPSGAGKDTLIAGAAAALAQRPEFVFQRRVITRPSSLHEANDTLDEPQFIEAESNGQFLFSWRAHGLRYGIPAVARQHLAAGRTVVCNVSRSVVAEARERFASTHVVEVTAGADVLEKRLALREREAPADRSRRLARSNNIQVGVTADFKIVNEGDIADAVAVFVTLLVRKSIIISPQ